MICIHYLITNYLIIYFDCVLYIYKTLYVYVYIYFLNTFKLKNQN